MKDFRTLAASDWFYSMRPGKMADAHIMLSGGFFECGLVRAPREASMRTNRTIFQKLSRCGKSTRRHRDLPAKLPLGMGNAFTVPLNEEVTMG